MKRAFDVFCSGTALLMALPVLLLLAIAIKLESSGPVLYASPRIGRNYKRFNLLKFRTMSNNADKQLASLSSRNQYGGSATISNQCHDCKPGQPCSPLFHDDSGIYICEQLLLAKVASESIFFKIKDDPRVTRLGRFMRNTSLDELPQLINVFKGDMSLIGNRPLPLYEAEKLTSDYAAERFFAPAGITGKWQVMKRGKGEMSEQERIALDIEYARSGGPKEDLTILVKTFPALLQSENV